jgi:hypothetical protein
MVQLSTKGLGNLPTTDVDDMFHFIVGYETYDCPFYVAAFLSPKVARLRSLDKTQDELAITTPDDKHSFASFLSLGRGSEFSITDSDSHFFLCLTF